MAPFLEGLASARAPWSRVGVWQVDEAVVPESHPARMWAQLWGLLAIPAAFTGIPVEPATDPSGAGAAQRYALTLAAPPCRAVLDLVVLALGPDGSIAALFPGDPALRERCDVVAVAARHGLARVTLTLPTLARARAIVVVAAGADRRAALAQLLAGDPKIPAGRLRHPDFTVFADAAAVGA